MMLGSSAPGRVFDALSDPLRRQLLVGLLTETSEDGVDERNREVFAPRVGEHAVLLALRRPNRLRDDRSSVVSHGSLSGLYNLKWP